MLGAEGAPWGVPRPELDGRPGSDQHGPARASQGGPRVSMTQAVCGHPQQSRQAPKRLMQTLQVYAAAVRVPNATGEGHEPQRVTTGVPHQAHGRKKGEHGSNNSESAQAARNAGWLILVMMWQS